MDFLREVVSRELAARQECHTQMKTVTARFHFQKTLESFDFKFQPSIEVKVIRELATGRFIADADNVLLLGRRVWGKTHLAVGIGLKACALGYRTMFTTAAGLVTSLVRAHNENHLEEKLKYLVQPKLLIIDEIGYLPIERLGANPFFQLVSINILDRLPKRHQRQASFMLKKMPVTSSRKEATRLREEFQGWYRKIGCAQAALIIENDWERMMTFYRLPEGALEAPANEQCSRVAIFEGQIEDGCLAADTRRWIISGADLEDGDDSGEEVSEAERSGDAEGSVRRARYADGIRVKETEKEVAA